MFIEIDISFYQLMLYFHNMLCGVDKSCSDGEFVWQTGKSCKLSKSFFNTQQQSLLLASLSQTDKSFSE